MHSVSEPIPIENGDQSSSIFGESAELMSFSGLSDPNNFLQSADCFMQEEPEDDFPISKLCGEVLENSAGSVGGNVFLTNYRIVVTENTRCGIATIPLTAVDSVEAREANLLIINCKYGRVYKFTLLNSGCACEWYKKLCQKTFAARDVSDIFAWKFGEKAKKQSTWLTFKKDSCDMECSAEEEFNRLGYDTEKWKISTANSDFKICETYPQKVVVPISFSDEDLAICGEARMLARFPVVVWHCKEKQTVLLRSSQPRVGFFSYRYELDERLIEHVRESTSKDSSTTLLIIDARSYTAVLGNRVKGGGVEIPDYYKQTEVEYMSLPNIHNIRYAFTQLRDVLQNKGDLQFFVSLQNTNWFSYLFSLIDSAFRCVCALLDEGRSVLVHCSDGWDRTTQITTLAKIIADPYYRTFKGFRYLIQRDWIDFGHKFRDRLGVLNNDSQEVSPVFLQWLDCVYQLHQHNASAFQFSTLFLAELALHAYSGLFGSFIWNSWFERKKYQSEVQAETLSVWSHFDDGNLSYLNFMYDPRSRIRLPRFNGLIDLVLWKELYMCSPAEERVNDPNDKTTISVISEGLRTSLNRSHSAESLAIIEGFFHTQNCDRAQAIVMQEPSTADVEPPSKLCDAKDAFFCHIDLEDRFRSLVGVSGIPKVVDRMEKIRLLLQKLLQEKEARLRNYFERKAQNPEQKRFSTAVNSALSVSAGELNFLNGSFSIADEDSESSSLDSASSVVLVNKAEVNTIYDGCKGQLLDAASKHCMRCSQSFWFSRRHHCRSCGGLFCSECSKHKYYRVRDSKGEQVRACEACYAKMASNVYEPSLSPSASKHSIIVRE